jgi:hypothetical protein
MKTQQHSGIGSITDEITHEQLTIGCTILHPPLGCWIRPVVGWLKKNLLLNPP